MQLVPLQRGRRGAPRFRGRVRVARAAAADGDARARAQLQHRGHAQRTEKPVQVLLGAEHG